MKLNHLKTSKSKLKYYIFSALLVGQLFLSLLVPGQIIAVQVATESALVSATIIAPTINPPILISPDHEAVTSNPHEVFVWQIPDSSNTVLSHFDFYLDDQLFASMVPVDLNIVSQYYFYTVYRQNNLFFLNPNQPLSDGWHTWRVVVYDTNNTHQSSETRSLYVDTTTPYIHLTKVNNTSYDYDTRRPEDMPILSQRIIQISSSNVLSGFTEAGVNLNFYLFCPSTLDNCSDTESTINSPNSAWQYTLANLIPNHYYFLLITATDSAGNSAELGFYLVYQTSTITPTVDSPSSPTVTPTITLPTPPGISYPPELETTLPDLPTIPVKPTPPVLYYPTPIKPLIDPRLLILFIVFGLPTHLILSSIEHRIQLSLILRYLWILIFPSLNKSRSLQTHPYSQIAVWDANELKEHYSTVADKYGYFKHRLSTQISRYIFSHQSPHGQQYKASMSSNEFISSCLIPLQSRSYNSLQTVAKHIKMLPLIVAILSSLYVLYFLPNIYLFIYLYLSLQTLYTEYIS